MANPEGMSSQGSGRSPGHKRETREIVRIVVAGLAVILLIAFVLDNSQTVKVGFVFFNAQLSLIWVLLIAALLGALVDRLVIYLSERRRRAAKPK
jgi:uncharacterized integral membrane protein